MKLHIWFLLVCFLTSSSVTVPPEVTGKLLFHPSEPPREILLLGGKDSKTIAKVELSETGVFHFLLSVPPADLLYALSVQPVKNCISSLTFTPSKARFMQAVFAVQTHQRKKHPIQIEALNDAMDGGKIYELLYVNGPATVKETFKCPGLELSSDLKLVPGWNVILAEHQRSPGKTRVTRTGLEAYTPSKLKGTNWVVDYRRTF